MNEKESSIAGIIIWGIITNELSLILDLENKLFDNFGKTIKRSEVLAFDYTKYYEPEMGTNLKRCWLVTANLKPLEQLADIKNFARNIESNFFDQQGKRRINIDPGFLTLSNFVLATTKNYGHRIYLKDDIFAEVTLIFRNRSFQALDWTYPDYRNAITFFNEVRTYLYQTIKSI